MPSQPLQYCSEKTFPPCRKKVKSGKCEDHRKARSKERERYRGSAASRGYDRSWQRRRKAFLKKNPLCIHCEAENTVTAATVVDHIIPHRGDKDLFDDRANWQALCKTHHDRKTATEEGSWTQRPT